MNGSESAPAAGPEAKDTAACARRWAGITLASVGLCISCYLAWLSLTGRVAPGCGSGEGCAQVLGSRWSAIGPVPVSVLAVAGYAVTLFLLLAQPGRRATREVWLGAIGVALIGAAAWYIALQATIIGAWCPYCLAGHGVGVALGLVLLSALPLRQLVVPVRVGVPAVVLLIGIQALVPASDPSIDTPNEGDYDIADDAGRRLGLLDGKLKLDAADTPHHGPDNGADVLVIVLDYACPHCREAHEMLDEALASRDNLVVFALPVSLHEDHNPHIPLDNPRFGHSHELALLSLAVWRDAPEQWASFDRWLFEGSVMADGELAWPRTLAAAEDEAASLIGDEAVAAAYEDAELLAQFDRNIAAIGEVLALSPNAVPGLPIAMAPYADGAIYGRFDEPRLLDTILDDARSGRE